MFAPREREPERAEELGSLQPGRFADRAAPGSPGAVVPGLGRQRPGGGQQNFPRLVRKRRARFLRNGAEAGVVPNLRVGKPLQIGPDRAPEPLIGRARAQKRLGAS